MVKKGKNYRLLYVLAILSLFVWSICSAYALDELFLTGFVENVDSRGGVITVDVQSESCPGIMTFRVEDVSKLEASEGKKISFFINSSFCNPREIYPIHDITFLRGQRP